jgi:hypothetical protein
LGKHEMRRRHAGDTGACDPANKLPSRYRHEILPTGTLQMSGGLLLSNLSDGSHK